MNRKEGYYWVKYSSELEIAFWDGESWKIFGRRFRYDDTELDEINETQILPPNAT